MQVDPISTRSRQAAAQALAEMREYHKLQALRRLARSDYLRLLGEIVQQAEQERQKNLELFARFKRGG